MRRISLTLLAAGAVLTCASPHAHAQYFNYTTDFENINTGASIINAFSTDNLSALGITDIAQTGVFASPGAVTVPLYQFATNSSVVDPPTGGTGGQFNYPYRVRVTIVPANAAGAPLAGYTAITEYVTGTITGRLSGTFNSLVNTYDNLVSTPSGQAEVFNYVFTSAGLPTLNFQLRALNGVALAYNGPGFYNGGTPVPQAGSATAAIAGTPEPGTVALFFGMSLSGAMVARRRMRRK